jgi:hypothetical protein
MADLVACRRWARLVAPLLVALVVPAGARAESATAGPPNPRIYLPKSVDVAGVNAALAGARRRLASASCQGLFAEFADKDGRPLAETLDALGHTGASYLGLLSFYNGDGAARCQQRELSIVAFTNQGSRVVYVCPGFAGVQHRYSDEAEATLIHEALHTLGLGENPPSSRYIQDRVRARCPSPGPSR